MKNRKSIYILLPIVLLVWGAVIYQFFSFTDNESRDSISPNVAIKPFLIKPRDTSEIIINNRDPFLGKITDNSTIPKIKKKISKAVIIKEEVNWPQVQYKGIVSDNKEKIKVYMIIINGKTHLMKKGDEEDGVKLKDGNRETIYAIYEEDLKVILIQ